jgi:hypothetical protein
MKLRQWLVVVITLGIMPAQSRAQNGGPPLRQAGAPVAVHVRSEVGNDLRFIEAVLYLNGERVAQRRATEDRELERVFRLWSSADPPLPGAGRVDLDGWLATGDHAMTVEVAYQGRSVGPFSYLSQYKYRVDASFVFTIEPNIRPVSIIVTASERARVEIPDKDKVLLSVQPGPGSGAVPALDPRGRARPRR